MVFLNTEARIEKFQMSTSLLSFHGHPLIRKKQKNIAKIGNQICTQEKGSMHKISSRSKHKTTRI
jgi:hypothetical protein